MTREARKWTFVHLTTGDPGADVPVAASAAGKWPTWATVLLGVTAVGAVAGVVVGVVGVAGSGSGGDTNVTMASPPPFAAASSSMFPPPSPPPPVPPVQPPYDANLAEDYCSNDCLGCAQNGGCTYSYGADGDPNTHHDAQYFQSNGVCDDGGPGSEYAICFYGMLPAPTSFPDTLKGLPILCPFRRLRLRGLRRPRHAAAPAILPVDAAGVVAAEPSE